MIDASVVRQKGSVYGGGGLPDVEMQVTVADLLAHTRARVFDLLDSKPRAAPAESSDSSAAAAAAANGLSDGAPESMVQAAGASRSESVQAEPGTAVPVTAGAGRRESVVAVSTAQLIGSSGSDSSSRGALLESVDVEAEELPLPWTERGDQQKRVQLIGVVAQKRRCETKRGWVRTCECDGCCQCTRYVLVTPAWACVLQVAVLPVGMYAWKASALRTIFWF